MGIATNYEAHENTVKSMSDQQIMQGMQNPNPSGPPPFMLLVEANTRKEMRDEQTRQEGLGQPTVLEGLMGAAPAPTPQTNVAGMPQGVASGMAQSMAPKTDTTKNTGIATMASGGILKMAPGGAVNQVIVTFAEDSPIYPGETRRMTQDTLEAMPRNSVQDVKGVADVGGVEAAKKVPYLPMSGGLKRQLKTIESESFPLIDTSNRNNVPPDNYGVSANLPPAGGAMSSDPAGGMGGNTDSSRLGLPKDEFSEVPLSSISTPKGLATLAAAGDADMLDETIGVQTAPSMPASPGIAAGTPFDNTKYTPRLPEKPIKAIQTGVDDKGRGIFIPSLEETQLDNLRGRSGVGAFSKVPFNATSDEAAKESVSQARVTADEPGTELAETAGRPASNAQLEAFTDAAALRNEALTVPTKPKVFDALEDIRFQEMIVNDSSDNQTPVDQILIDQVKKLGTPQEQAAAIKLINNKHTAAVKAEEAALVALAEARKNDTGVYGAKKKLEAAQKETNRIQRVAPWAVDDNNNKFVFGPEIAKLVEAQAADDLQAEAVADVAKVTTAEPVQAEPTKLSPADLTEYLSRTNSKGQPGGTALTLEQQMENAKTAITNEADDDADAGENSVTNAYNVFMGNTAADSLITDGPFMPNEDTRIKRMKALAEQINSGELTGNALFSAQKTLERLRKGVVRSGGEEELGNYLAKQTAQGVKKALPYAVDTADYVVRNLGLGTLAGATLGPRAEGFLLDKTDAAQTNTASPVAEIPTSANEVAAEAIASSVSKGDLTGPKPSGSVSLGAAITDSQQKEQAAINAAQGIDELSFLNNDSNAEVQRRAGLYRDASTEQDAINVERERREAEAALAAAVGTAPSPAGAPMPFSKDNTGIDSAEQFYNNLPLLDQSVKNGNVVTPATRTGIATIGGSGATSRSEGQPNTSSYEQKLLDILDKREKSADQDKWLGLAEMGMRLMASSNPNMLSAIGEAGLGASQTFLGNKRKAEAQEMDVLSKLSALEARKQIADDANRTRLQAASMSRSGKPAAGSYASVNQALSGIGAQISAIEGSMSAQPPTESRALDAYNKQIKTLSLLREQQQRLMSTNPVVASIFANVDGANAPAAVDLSK